MHSQWGSDFSRNIAHTAGPNPTSGIEYDVNVKKELKRILAKRNPVDLQVRSAQGFLKP